MKSLIQKNVTNVISDRYKEKSSHMHKSLTNFLHFFWIFEVQVII